MNKVLLLLITLTVAAAAQKQNPQTEMALPSDSLQAKQGKPDAQSPQLELPDVLILGEDRYHRLVKNKKNLTPETPTIVEPQNAYVSPAFWHTRQGDKPYAGSVDSAAMRTWGRLLGGTFYTVAGDAGHWRKIPNGDAMAALWIERSEGQYLNTQYAQGGFDGKINYALNEQATLTGRTAYDRHVYGLHTTGFHHPNSRRSVGNGMLAADLNYRLDRISSVGAGLEFGGLSMTTDTGGVEAAHSGNFFYHLRGEFNSSCRKTLLAVRGSYLHETLDTPKDSVGSSAHFGEIGVELMRPLSPFLSATVGMGLQGFGADTTSSSRPAGLARINFIPNGLVGALLQISSGMRYATFADYWRQNRYLVHTFDQVTAEEKIGVKADFDLQTSAAIKLHVGFHRRRMAKLPFWQADSANGLIALKMLSDVEITQVELGVAADLGALGTLYAAFIDYADDARSGSGHLNQIPYRPDFRLPVRAALHLPAGINVTATAELVGARRKQFGSDAVLPAHFRFALDADRRFSRHITALLTVRNLFNTRYSIWENYPETGFIVMAGIRARF